MKKTTKGAIAAGAAAVLLAGGAGSFAAWNASTDGGDGGTVEAGSMSITEGDGQWTWAGGGVFDPANELLVPGDKVEYTAEYDIKLVGTNLEAKLTPSLDGVSEEGLGAYLKVSSSSDTQTTYVAGDHKATFTTVIEFDPTTVNTDGANETADLAGGTVTLDQVITTAP